VSDKSAKRRTTTEAQARNQGGPGALFSVTAVAGKTPEPPPRPQKLSSDLSFRALREPGPFQGFETGPERRDPVVQGEARGGQ
jgi:hypothetical protein